MSPAIYDSSKHNYRSNESWLKIMGTFIRNSGDICVPNNIPDSQNTSLSYKFGFMYTCVTPGLTCVVLAVSH